jgi:uncharacterized protein YeaO (DUF488 family)
MIRIRRVYEPPVAAEGPRLLVDRVWPRGLSRADAALAGWYRELAPSTPLRQWFGHDPVRFEAFRQRYQEELRAQGPLVDDLLSQARAGDVVLVYAASDTQHNNAVVLRDFLQGLL